MAGFEQTLIIGNVGRDPDIKYLPSGTAVCNFSVAVSSVWKDKQTGEKREKTNWYSCSVFGGQAETVNQYVKKGSQLMLLGTVEARAYTGNDGEARASLDMRIDRWQFVGGRVDNDSAPASSTPATGDIPF